MSELSAHAIEMLKTLQPGMVFTVFDYTDTFECRAIEHPVEGEPWVRAVDLEGKGSERTRRANRSVRISRVQAIVDGVTVRSYFEPRKKSR